ncbi:MAG: hypothetical protein ACR2JP_10215 [Acidimicrobiia bacterium]
MTQLLSQCIFCGSPRPREIPRCAACKRGWIDSKVAPARHAAATAPAAPTPPATAHTDTDTDTGTGAPAAATAPTPPPPVPAAPTAAVAAAATASSTLPVDPVAPAVMPTPGRSAPVSEPPPHPVDDGTLHLDRSKAATPAGGGGGNQRRNERRNQRLLVAGIVAAIIAGWFGVLTWISGDDPGVATATATTVARTVTTAAGTDTTAAPLVGPGTTLGDPDPTATAAPEPTTTIASSVLDGPFEEVGDPIPISQLDLGGFAIGPIDFGDADGLGRLVAALGQPDTATAIDDGSLGLCPGEPGFSAAWGPFTALFTGDPETGTLAGYRLLGQPAGHPTAALSTLSGLSVGDTIADLEAIYAGFEIGYEEVEQVLSFILVRSDGFTLLWGPVSSSDPDGTVLGIYSPRPCDAGPTR